MENVSSKRKFILSEEFNDYLIFSMMSDKKVLFYNGIPTNSVEENVEAERFAFF